MAVKVLLAGPDREENLSLRYLASSLAAAGHHAILAPFECPGDIERIVDEAGRADIVGLSMCFQVRAREFLEVARRVKELDPAKLVVAGGHFASCAAEPLLRECPHIDIVVIHEGEKTLVEIAGAARAGSGVPAASLPGIRGIAFRQDGRVVFTDQRPALVDLDSLQPPDRSGPARLLAGVPTAYIMGSRGCLGSCAYCCIAALHSLAPGPRLRRRDPGCVADEMSSLYHDRGVRLFVFHDDNYLVPSQRRNMERVEALASALDERGVTGIGLTLKCRPADVARPVMEKLRAMGLVRVFLGVESATQSGLASLRRRQTVEDSERALALMDDLGISAQFTLMTFNPDATVASVREDLAFMRSHATNPLNWCRAEIYAGTPLLRRMMDEGRARGGWLARDYGMLDPGADLTSQLAGHIFHGRCWSPGSLMESTIGTDHLAHVARLFYGAGATEALGRDISSWVLRSNRDTLDLLEALLDACATAPSPRDPGFRTTVREIASREQASRASLLAEGNELRSKLDAIARGMIGLDDRWMVPPPTSQKRHPRPGPALARHAAAVLLSLAVAGSSCCRKGSGCGPGVCEYAPAPMPGEEIGVCEYAAPPLEDTGADAPSDMSEAETPPPGAAATDAVDISGDPAPDQEVVQPPQKAPDVGHGVHEYAAPRINSTGILDILGQDEQAKKALEPAGAAGTGKGNGSGKGH